MILVGEVLKEFIEENNVLSSNNFDQTCISLSLGNCIIKMIPNEKCTFLKYGKKIPEECIKREDISSAGLTLAPHSSVLAMSEEEISMPLGYFGFLQTKGSLARLMVSLHFSDGQIDPGFKGHVTFEICNASDFFVHIDYLKAVGNLYIFEVCGDSKPYNGKYANSTKPTIQVPF